MAGSFRHNRQVLHFFPGEIFLAAALSFVHGPCTWLRRTFSLCGRSHVVIDGIEAGQRVALSTHIPRFFVSLDEILLANDNNVLLFREAYSCKNIHVWSE